METEKRENTDNIFFVVKILHHISSNETQIVFAKHSNKYNTLYDYRHRVYEDDRLNTLNYKVGQKVILQKEYGDVDDFTLVDSSIDMTIVNLMEEEHRQYSELKAKYKNNPKTGSLSAYTYYNDLKNRKEDVNPYIVGIIDMLSGPMDLRLINPYASQFVYTGSYGFNYPETITRIYDAMYDIIQEKLSVLSDDETFSLTLFNGFGNGEDYEEFAEEIQLRTGIDYRISSAKRHELEFNERFFSVNYNAYLNTRKSLSKYYSVAIIGKKTSTYTPKKDETNANGSITITPESCKERFIDHPTDYGSR